MSRLRRLVELLAVLALLALLVGQLRSFGITEDPDPDGYVSYARHLQETWSLPPGHRRLPGYPLFLATVDDLGPGTLHEDATYAQGGLYLLWVVVLWLGVRRLLGAVVALVFLAICAGPSLPARLGVTLLSDAPAAILATLAAWMLWRAVSHSWRWIAPLAVLGAAAYAVHPTSRAALTLLVVGLAAAYVLRRERVPVVRLVACLVAFWASTAAVEAVADSGSARYNADALQAGSLLCLPAVADTEADRRIEGAKAALAARLGHPVEDANPQAYPETTAVLRLYPNVVLRPLWYGRLMAHPLRPVGCALRQATLRWHILAKQYAPFWSERRLVTPAYLPATGSPRSVLFRATGVDLWEMPDAASWDHLRWPLIREVGRVLACLVPLVVGAVVLVRRLGTPALAVVLAGLLWCAALGLTHVLDARYLVVFAPGIALAQAVGIVAAVRMAGRGVSRGPGVRGRTPRQSGERPPAFRCNRATEPARR